MDSYGQVWLVLKKKQETKKMIMAAFLNIAIFAAVFSSLFPTSYPKYLCDNKTWNNRENENNNDENQKITAKLNNYIFVVISLGYVLFCLCSKCIYFNVYHLFCLFFILQLNIYLICTTWWIFQ